MTAREVPESKGYMCYGMTWKLKAFLYRLGKDFNCRKKWIRGPFGLGK